MIESFSDPYNLLYYPSATVVLRTWVEHKLAGNSVQVYGPVVLLYHMKIFHGSLVLVYSVLASWVRLEVITSLLIHILGFLNLVELFFY